ncbi:PaaI family thioesterase [Enteractinococcus coprophilus]|nr:PaaI family thioesterase [Enteractinococcus coprophilus]
MTTSQRMDAIEMTEHRRRPFPHTEQAAAYLDMMAQVGVFQDTLVAANPETAQARQIQAKLAELIELLASSAVPEHERLYALGDFGSGESQALLPPLVVDHFDDDALHAHFVPGQFAMGMNQAMHGGVVSLIFDTLMGRMAAGLQGIPCRTAYLNTQYRHVAPVEQRLELHARVESIEGRKRFIVAQLLHGQTLCAEADALFVAVRQGQH